MTGTNKKYLYLSRGVRKGDKVKHENLVSFGAVDELNEKELKKIAFKLLSYCQNNEFIDLSQIREESRHNWGAMAITKSLFKKFSIDLLISKLLSERKIKINILLILNFLISERLSGPKSKYAAYKNQDWYIQNPSINLQNIYRTIDFLADHTDVIKKHLFEVQKNLFNLDISVVFYDVTTLYFESKQEDSLKKFGYSKDCKFSDVQVVVGAMIDKTGRPLDYEVFSGNTYEGHTLKNFVERVKNKFHLKEVIFVTDRGLNSSKNLFSILDAGEDFHFIVGHRAKNATIKLQEQILSDDGYIDISNNSDEILKYKIISSTKAVITEDGGIKKIKTQIVATYSSSRAKKDSKDRARLIDKARDMVGNNHVINSKRGAKKYINIEANIESIELNEDKILSDSKWDGYYTIEFSNIALSAQEVLAAYHSLWRIEDLFRSLKTHLEARPIWHWTPKRVIGHFTLCFLALVIERTLEIECYNKYRETSPSSIRAAINSLQLSKINLGKKELFVFSKVTEYAKTILEIAKLDIPPPILSPEKFSKIYL